jgi:cytochrome P450
VQRTWEPRIRTVVEDVLYPLIETRESVERFDDFTRVSGIIAAEMLGVPAEHHEDIRRWSSAVITNLSFGHESPEQLRVMADAVSELNEYLDSEIERHHRYELNDLLTTMITLSDWTEAEIRSSAVNLLLAGSGTTSKLMGECLVALEQHPDQRRLVADEPGLLPNAIEEVLRCYGPTQAIVRLAAQDTVLGGVEVGEGETVYAMLIAANRDPSRWSYPQRWDILRRFQTPSRVRRRIALLRRRVAGAAGDQGRARDADAPGAGVPPTRRRLWRFLLRART